MQAGWQVMSACFFTIISQTFTQAWSQRELSDAATSVNENLQKITYSSENMSQETKEVLESVNSLQETMQSFQV